MNVFTPSSMVVFFSMDMAIVCAIVLFFEHRFLTIFPDRIRKRWKLATRFLVVIPIFIVLFLGGLILWVWKTEPEIRFVHALLVLSLWMPITFMVFSILFSPQKSLSALLIPALAILLGSIPVMRITSIDGFHTVFAPVGFFPPLGIAALTLAVMYFSLFRLNKKLSGVSRMSTASFDPQKTEF